MTDNIDNKSRRTFIGGSVATATALGAFSFLKANAASKTPSAPAFPVFGPDPGIAKLNANENPYGPSPAAIEAITKASTTGGAYYAYKTAQFLMDMIAERHFLTRDNISLSGGSSGLLSYLALAASKKGRILGPDLFWDTTAMSPQKQGGEKLKRTAKTADMGIDLDALYAAIDDDVSMVCVCNPNNPTGMKVDPVKLKEFCIKASKKTLVLVDEAYNELMNMPEENSMVPLVKAGHNVVIARTFSKIYGLAGMRVGYFIAAPDTLKWINDYGMGGYSLNQAGLAAAIASYNDEAFLKYSKQKVVQCKEMVLAGLKANGLQALPSETNFMFVDLKDGNAEIFRQKMAEEKVHIRGIYRDYNNWSRVSMGKVEDVARYVEAIPKALEAMYKEQQSMNAFLRTPNKSILSEQDVPWNYDFG